MAGVFDVLRSIVAISATLRRGRKHDPIRPPHYRIGPGRRRPRRDGLSGPLPVEPNRPDGLSGGAAAALEFDDWLNPSCRT